jgi:multidrug resistance efflux pump
LTVVAARATVTTDQAALIFARQQLSRYRDLARIGAGTVQDAQQWQADISEKGAALARDTAQVGVAQKHIDVFGAALEQARAMLAQQHAALRQAELNLGYTTITALVDGTVGDSVKPAREVTIPGNRHGRYTWPMINLGPIRDRFASLSPPLGSMQLTK